MRKLFVSLLAAALSLNAMAEGYQVNTLSTKQLGMGHAGVALKLDSESIWFNPAAAAHQESRFSYSLGVTAISPKATFEQNDYTGSVISHENVSKISTPIHLYFNYKLTDDLALGLSFNTPYGSSIDWGDNWAGAHLVQDISLESYNVQPTISYKLLDDKLSIGGGLSIAWGSFSLSRSMFPVGDASNNAIAGMLTAAGMGDYAPVIQGVGNNPLLSAKLGGDAGVKFGFNVGAMYDINEQWTIGASYRSKIMMGLDAGTAELIYANSAVQQILAATGIIPKLDQGTFSSELPLPSTLSIGAAFRPTDKWEFTTELQYVGWSAYEDLTLTFNEPELKIEDIYSVKNYDNTIMVRMGAQFDATDWLIGRVGLYVDESPVRSDYLNPETPSMTKIGYTAGFSILPTQNRNLTIDVSYGYLTSADPERMGSYPYENILAGGAMQPFVGNYTTSAHMLSIGTSLKF